MVTKKMKREMGKTRSANWVPPEVNKPEAKEFGQHAKSLPKGITCKYCSKPLKILSNKISKINWVYCTNKKCVNYLILRNEARYGISWGNE